mgnify:CR=1 FL=1
MSSKDGRNLVDSHDQTARQRLTASLLQELQPQNLFNVLSAGLICGVITVIISIAFASLIFADTLPRYLPGGINLLLMASIVIAIIATLTSSLRGVVAGVQDSPVAIMAVVAAAIAKSMLPTARPNEVFFTIVAAMGLSTLLTGLFFFVLGHFQLGNLVRFVPYPVIGGFLGGTGMLLVVGALSMMTTSFSGLADLPQLFTGTTMWEWLPGTIFAILLFVALNRFSHPLTLPAMVLGASVVFYFLPRWLPWPLPQPTPPAGGPMGPADASLRNVMVWLNTQHVNGAVLLQHAISGVSVAVVSVISLLLNATGLELALQRDIDLNRELKVMGLTNVLAGVGGSAASTHILSETVLVHRMGGKSRLVGFVVAAVCGVVLLTGDAVLRFFPQPVLGGVLLFLGLDFLITWLYKTWDQLPRADYGILILILLVTTLVGFLEGIGLGLVLTVLLFVVDYSRVDVVRHILSGATYQSNFQYPRLYQQMLKRRGQQIYIFELQGFIFFGTAHTLLEQIKTHLEQEEGAKPRFIVLDFRLVSGLDTSAVFSFTRMQQLAQSNDITLVFTHLSPPMQRQLEKGISQSEKQDVWRIFPDLDRGVEWCEAQFLATLKEVGFDLHARQRTPGAWLEKLPANDNFDKLRAFLGSEDQPAARERTPTSRPFDAAWLQSHLEPLEVAPGDVLIQQGEATEGLYFIASGQVTVRLEQDDGTTLRLSTMGAGAVVGELSFYLNIPASASVIVDQPGQMYVVSQATLKEIEATDPHFKAALHEMMARLLSERLAHADVTLRALLK